MAGDNPIAAAAGEGAKPQDPKAGEGTRPQEPQAQGEAAQEAAAGEGAKPQDPTAAEAAASDHKLEADYRRAQKTVAELRARLAERDGQAKTVEERVAALERELAASRAEAEAERANAALAAAGCLDPELGRAALASFDGDVASLKAAKPYLFRAQAKGTGRPVGAAGAGPARSIHEAVSDYRK